MRRPSRQGGAGKQCHQRHAAHSLLALAEFAINSTASTLDARLKPFSIDRGAGSKIPLPERCAQRYILLLRGPNANTESRDYRLSAFQAFLFVFAFAKTALLFLLCRPFPFQFAKLCHRMRRRSIAEGDGVASSFRPSMCPTPTGCHSLAQSFDRSRGSVVPKSGVALLLPHRAV